MKRILFAFLIVMLTSVYSYASEDIIDRGFAAFKEKGVEAAWEVWSKGGPLEGTKELKSQAAQFGQIGAYYGKYVSHDYVLTKELSPNNKIVFVIVNFDKGPLFCRFLLFKTSSGVWMSPFFRLHTDVTEVWPSRLYVD